MEKEKILKEYYISRITALVERCNDVDLLDLVYRLLEKEAETKTVKRKTQK